MLLEMRCLNWDRDADFQKVQVQVAFWIASAGPHHILLTLKVTFPYRTCLCPHSWSRYQRVVCMSLASLPSGAGRKSNQKVVPKQEMELENKEITPLHQLSMAWGNCLPSFSLPLGLFMTLCKILKPWISETPTHLLGVPNTEDPFAAAGSICHLQWSHQHQLQEPNKNFRAQLPQPLLSPWGWEGGNCSRAFSGCQRLTRS